MDVNGVTGHSVVVTGAAGGIGRATADLFAAAGARVALWDRTAVDAVSTDAVSLACDVTDANEVRQAFEETVDRIGRVSILVHAAGVMRAGSALVAHDDDWNTCMAVNATGVINTVREAGRRFRSAGAGAITVIGSNAAAAPRTNMAAYGASKAAATAYVRSLGLELAPHGVRCNVISPGSTDTPMLRGMWQEGQDQSAAVIAGDAAAFRLGIPLGRVASPRDIAEAALYLSSDAARHITMHDLRIDGGATLDM